MDFKDIDLGTVGNEVLLVGGVWAGNGSTLVCLFPEFGEAEGDIHVLSMTTDEWQALIRQSDLMEAEVLAKAEDGKLYKAVARKCQRNIEQGISWRVYRRDGYRCRYCGNDEVPLTVDHLVLWEEGGPSIEANLVAADRRCNKRRGSLSYAEWLEHPYYKKVSRALTEEQREANRKLLETLDTIPRVFHKRSR